MPVREWRGHHTGLATHPTSDIRWVQQGTGRGTHHEWRKAMRVDGLALCDCHRAEGPPVVCALHRDNVLLACDAADHLERGLDRL